jgi:predicted dehydrogenase
MNVNKLGVGIIGASPNGGWGSMGHIPALQALPNFEVTAVSTTRQESANETSKRFGIPHAFTDPYELSIHPDVDIVTITVRVPEHDKLVRAALNAGKHVYCEFPLGRTTKEAADLLQMAEDKGVRHIIGLQARANPAVNYVKDLISSGYVGKILSVNVSYSLPPFPSASGTIDQGHVYILDKTNGANQLTIGNGHLLDGITYMLGQFSEVSAILGTQFQNVKVIETGEIVQATSPDYVLVNGIMENGAIISSHVRNTTVAGLTLEINGTEGDLVMVSKDKMMFQMDSFILKGAQGQNKDFQELTIPSRYYLVPSELNYGPAYNVAQLYTKFYKDLRENTHDTPDFNTAVNMHNLFDTIETASETGIRQRV